MSNKIVTVESIIRECTIYHFLLSFRTCQHLDERFHWFGEGLLTKYTSTTCGSSNL